MPTRTAADTFLKLLDRSGIVPADQVSDVVRELEEAGVDSPSAQQVADELVEREALTRWQADQLLDGKCKGFIIGPYRILAPLGQGGMGTVFLAEHEVMRRRCAIKVLPWKRVQAQPELVEWFVREARAVGALDHPNIVRAYDVNKAVQDDREINYLVMQYVDGQDLQRRIQEHGVADYHQAAEWIRQAAEGLAHAHESGFVHRDVKPANLLVDSHGVVKILDLGLARFFNDTDGSANGDQGGAVVGTADYLAPEQVVNAQNVDGRADIYSLGHTFYFLLTGHPPFPDGSVPQRLMAHQTKFPEPILKQRPDVPAELVGIIGRMTAKKPKDRYQSAREVAEALKKWLEGSPEVSGFMRRFIRTGPSNTPPPTAVRPRPQSKSPEDERDLELAPIEEDQETDEPPTATETTDSGAAQPAVAEESLEAASEDTSPADHEATSPPIDLTDELGELSAPSDPLAELLAAEASASAAPSSLHDADPAVAARHLPAARKPQPGKPDDASLVQSPVVWAGLACLVVVIAIVWLVASQFPGESPPLDQPVAVVPAPAGASNPIEPKLEPESPPPAESPKPPAAADPGRDRSKSPEDVQSDSGEPKAKPQVEPSKSPKESSKSPESSAGRKQAPKAKPKPKPSQPKTAPEAKPQEETKEKKEPPSKPKEAEKTDVKTLLGSVEKIAFRPVKSIERDPRGRFNMMVWREAQEAAKHAGLALVEDASAITDDSLAVMDLAIEAVPSGPMAEVILSAELNVIGSDEKPLKVWEHRTPLGTFAVQLLRRGIPTPVIGALRDEVGKFFDKFVNDYREASGKQ